MEERTTATLEKIQEAALAEFLEKGFQGASLRQIVKNAGVTTGAFYTAIQDYSDLASQYAMSCRTGQTCFLTFINGAFALLIPAALLIASGGDVRTALVNLIFYALFAPARAGGCEFFRPARPGGGSGGPLRRWAPLPSFPKDFTPSRFQTPLVPVN